MPFGWVAPLALCFMQAAALQPLLIQNVEGRRTQDLDGTWRAIVDPYDAGWLGFHGKQRKDGYFEDAKPKDASDLVEYDFDTSPTLTVPGDWNSQRPELLLYEGSIWYRRKFDVARRPGRRYFLHFGAVNQRARVFLNGTLVGEHEGGFTPFDLEVTSELRDHGNSLVVQANDRRRPEGVPALMTDWWNYGGLTRPVRLVSLPETFVQDYFLHLEPGPGGIVEGWVRLNGPRPEQSVHVRIAEAGVDAAAETDASGYAAFHFRADLELWSPERPKLYDVEIASQTDAVRDRIGFRTLVVRGRDILLNGRPVFLRGVSVHEEAPFRGGRAFSTEDAATLLGWVKELGGNFVRLAHYPHSEAMLREADRLGLLVWSEIPVYWSIAWSDPRALASARRQLAESITRDRNRAAVALWSVANETPPGHARDAFLGALIEEARRLDPSRLVTAALLAHAKGEDRLMIDDPIGARLDVMGENEYLGWYDGPPQKADRMQFTSPYPKPLIMSELGAGALAGRHGPPDERWTEEYQAAVYEHQLRMLDRIPFLRGLSPWILMDFRSPRRALPGVQDGWNRKGLVSERGQRKLAFYVLQRYYRQRTARER